MQKRCLYFILLGMMLLVSGCKNKPGNTDESKITKPEKTQRIISLNGAITEIVYDLGRGDELVGRDVTSTYPQWVKDSVKDLGHVRSLNMESVMDLHPSLILTTDRDMNSDLEKSIEASGVKFKVFPQEFSVEGTKNLIREVAKFIGGGKTRSMMDKIDRNLNKVEAFEHPPKVLFVYARGAGTLLVAGEGTPMEKMIELAGGENAVKGFSNFKPLTEEALLESNPDVILLFNSGLESLGQKNGLLQTVPAILQTKAGAQKAIITMEGGLLSDFGPRVGKAAYQLNQLLAPYAE